jgi:hypothetical protein
MQGHGLGGRTITSARLCLHRRKMVYQINALVPQDAPVRDGVPLKATIAGVASNTVLIAVR